MVGCCIVPGCNSSGVVKENLRFHTFPVKNNVIRELWLCAINRPHWTPTKNSKICSEHFVPADYTSPRRLKSDAVPTRMLPCSCTTSPSPTVDVGENCNLLGNEDVKPIFPDMQILEEHCYNKEYSSSLQSRGTQTVAHCDPKDKEYLKRKIRTLQQANTRSRKKIQNLRDRIFKLKMLRIEPDDVCIVYRNK